MRTFFHSARSCWREAPPPSCSRLPSWQSHACLSPASMARRVLAGELSAPGDALWSNYASWAVGTTRVSLLAGHQGILHANQRIVYSIAKRDMLDKRHGKTFNSTWVKRSGKINARPTAGVEARYASAAARGLNQAHHGYRFYDNENCGPDARSTFREYPARPSPRVGSSCANRTAHGRDGDWAGFGDGGAAPGH